MNYPKINYWKMDFKRAFESGRWLLSILGVCTAFFFCGFNYIREDFGILYIVDQVFWGRMVMLTVPFCTLAYGDSICADCERKFYRQLYLRGNRKKYLYSKISVCFLSAWSAMTVGFLLFYFFLSLKIPVMSGIDITDITYFYTQSYGILLKEKFYLLYFFMLGSQFGLLAGILSVLSMALSAFLSNRLFVFAAPLFLYYFWINLFSDISGNLPYLQFYLIFKAFYSNPWGNDLLNFLWVIFITGFFCALAGKIAELGMNRRCLHD